MATLKGFATIEGTEAYAEKHLTAGFPSHAYRTFGRTDWTVSALGFGCYRVDDETPSQAQAMKEALLRGVNLIDTSTNYMNGSSERCVGAVVGEVSPNVPRAGVIVVSKVGYVQGQNLELAVHREESGNPYPEMVKYAEGCWHCIHPDYLHDQLTRSMDRTHLEKTDVYLLHNPEYFFSDAIHRKDKRSIGDLRAAFYRRIEASFEQLETEVANGRIQYYGVSSNTFGKGDEEMEMTSVEEMWKIAEKIGKARYGSPDKHHFAVIQLPMNLFESGPWLEANNGDLSALEFAAQKNLAVLVNRPLNAFSHNQLVRLADFKELPTEKTLAQLTEEINLKEKEFKEKLASKIQTESGSIKAEDFFTWGDTLSSPQLQHLSYEQWADFEYQIIRPQVYHLFEQLGSYFKEADGETWKNWGRNYAPLLESLLQQIRYECSQRSQATSNDISKKLAPFIPESWQKHSLSRKTMAALLNTQGVTTVLNGMREPAYVDDSIGAMRLAHITTDKKLYQAFDPRSC